jgi:hypothetical protein
MRVACEHCNKKFRNEGAMRMHEKAAHPHKLVNKVAAVRKTGRVQAYFAGFGSGVVAVAAGLAIVVILAQPGDKASPIVKAAYDAVARR